MVGFFSKSFIQIDGCGKHYGRQKWQNKRGCTELLEVLAAQKLFIFEKKSTAIVKGIQISIFLDCNFFLWT